MGMSSEWRRVIFKYLGNDTNTNGPSYDGSLRLPYLVSYSKYKG